MGAVVGSPTSARVIYCTHDHDLGERCNERCNFDTQCPTHNTEPTA